MKKIFSLFIFALLGVTTVAAAPPGSPYNLGETLNPTCAPGDANCTVTVPIQDGNNTGKVIGIDTTSISSVSKIQINDELDAAWGPRTTDIGVFSAYLTDGSAYQPAIMGIERTESVSAVSPSIGIYGEANHVGTFAFDEIRGGDFEAAHNGTGLLNKAYGLVTYVDSSSGPVTDAAGIFVNQNAAYGGGTIANNYGLRVQSQHGVGSANYGVRAESAAGEDFYVSYFGPDYSSFGSGSQGYLDYTSNAFATLNSGSTGRGSAIMGVNEDNSSSGVVGIYGVVYSTNAAGSRNVSGIAGDAYHTAGGTVGDLSGVAGYVDTSSGTVNRMASLWANTNGHSGGTVTNNYGLFISDQAGVGTNNYAIYYDGSSDFIVEADGDVGIGGVPNAAAALDVYGSIYQSGGVLHADYVFEDDYELESIEDHAEYMWANKHLPAVGAAQYRENGEEIVDVGAQRRGMLEELEKAHVYIEQLHEDNKVLKELVCLDHAAHVLCQ